MSRNADAIIENSRVRFSLDDAPDVTASRKSARSVPQRAFIAPSAEEKPENSFLSVLFISERAAP